MGWRVINLLRIKDYLSKRQRKQRRRGRKVWFSDKRLSAMALFGGKSLIISIFSSIYYYIPTPTADKKPTCALFHSVFSSSLIVLDVQRPLNITSDGKESTNKTYSLVINPFKFFRPFIFPFAFDLCISVRVKHFIS